MNSLPLLLALFLLPAVWWSTAAPAQEENFLLDEDDDEEEVSEEQRQTAELKRLIREKRFDYVFRGIDTPPLAGRAVTINGTPIGDAELERRILAPIFRIEIQGTTPGGAPYAMERQYLYTACRRGREQGRWLDRYPIYRCIL